MSAASPEVGEVRFYVWMSLVEAVKVEDMVMVGLAEGDRESPVYAIVIVKEEDCSSAV
jgi:hypothetical protein